MEAMIRKALTVFAVSFLFGVTASAQERAGMKLEDSGFKMKGANTHKEMERLKSIPARKFVRRTKKGVAYFIYADPDFCKCAYIGNQQAMDNFRAMNAPVSGLPGYAGPVDLTKPSGASTEAEMVTDMGEDGTDPQFEDDIFHPGF